MSGDLWLFIIGMMMSLVVSVAGMMLAYFSYKKHHGTGADGAGKGGSENG